MTSEAEATQADGLPADNPVIALRLRSEIQLRGPITFARFMEIVLYDPEAGYYTGPEATSSRPPRAICCSGARSRARSPRSPSGLAVRTDSCFVSTAPGAARWR